MADLVSSVSPHRQGDHSGCVRECASLGEEAETGEGLEPKKVGGGLRGLG